MKIVWKYDDKMKFSEVQAGVVFKYGERLFMKMKDTATLCSAKYQEYMVDIGTGMVDALDPGDRVEVMDAEVYVKPLS